MLLQIENLCKSFPAAVGKSRIEVLSDLDLQVDQGETVAVVGHSGSGKSTLLSLLAGLDLPTSGTLKLNSRDLTRMDEAELTRFRAENIGIVFQQFHLMPHLNALENVQLPLEIFGETDFADRACRALEQVELQDRVNHFPHQLSGGECQRVAIGRSIVTQPAILLADEPTGNLDSRTGEHVADVLFELVRTTGMTMVLVTHNEKLAGRCSRQLTLAEGKLQ